MRFWVFGHRYVQLFSRHDPNPMCTSVCHPAAPLPTILQPPTQPALVQVHASSSSSSSSSRNRKVCPSNQSPKGASHGHQTFQTREREKNASGLILILHFILPKQNSRADGLEDLGEAAHGHGAIGGRAGAFGVLEDVRQEDVERLRERRADHLTQRQRRTRIW